MTRCERGASALLRLLDTRLRDLREVTPTTFGSWLERHLRGWSVDPVFQQRVRIRQIRRANPMLQRLERERQVAREAYEASPAYRILEQRRRELVGGDNAVAGLEYALGRATVEEERAGLREKLSSYRAVVRDLLEELARLREESPEWKAFHEAASRLGEARTATGFDREAARLADLQRDHGRSSGRSGSAFERSAASIVQTVIFADLARDYDTARLRILHGVRLGSARAEFDHLVVRTTPDPGTPVEVVAAVEAKRNPNDLAHGLRNRADNLGWFAGREGSYDPEAYRTAGFPTGHFDRPARHIEKNGDRYLFAPESFAAFSDESRPSEGGLRLPGGLYLVSRPGWLWGVGSGGLARIAHRVSSDVDFDLQDPDYLASLLEWSKRLAHRVEAPDLLRSLATNEEEASRVLLVSED